MRPHVFTRWARHQLLQHVGTREKWFRTVPFHQQASELNERRHTFHKHKFRLMRGSDARVVRGLVSDVYTDIPDTEVMEALTNVLPDGQALKHFSGKTDRAMYAYMVSPRQLAIPGTGFLAYPGVIIKNSEVGYTSLWVIPFLWMPENDSVACFTSRAPFKRIHRGAVKELREKFEKALEESSVFWGELDKKLARLTTVTYTTEDDAVEALRTLLRGAGATKLFMYRCEQAYQAAKHHFHSGRSIFETILVVVRRQDGEDAAHDHAAIAGAVLTKLIF
jgi:hypothetical protein